MATCGPPFRRYPLATLYLEFLSMVDEHEFGRLQGPALERTRRFIL
jgi:hypothetical protein